MGDGSCVPQMYQKANCFPFAASYWTESCQSTGSLFLAATAVTKSLRWLCSPFPPQCFKCTTRGSWSPIPRLECRLNVFITYPMPTPLQVCNPCHGVMERRLVSLRVNPARTYLDRSQHWYDIMTTQCIQTDSSNNRKHYINWSVHI